MIADFFHFLKFPIRENNSELAKLVWLVKLRWMAVVCFLVLTVPALLFGYLNRSSVSIYLGLLGILLLFNLLTHVIWTEKARPISPFFLCFQLAFDLVILTTLLFSAGGYHNPFIILFLLHASLGAVLIPGHLGLPFLLLTHTFLAALQFHYVKEEIFNGQIVAAFTVFHFLIFVFWIVMRSLGAYLENQNERDLQAQVSLEKRDRLRAVGALAAGFSHEFATPLNAAKIRIDRSLRNAPSEDLVEAKAALESCEEVIRQMNSGQLDVRSFQFKEIIVADLLSDVVESWEHQNPQAKLDIQIKDRKMGSLPPINFAQVVLNLLDNAFQAAVPGSEIKVILSGNEGQFHLSVCDQGPGVALGVLEKLGEPFVTTKPQGTGLGLYVTQMFVQSLGGSLRIQNHSKGAEIILVWPKARQLQ